MMNARPDESVAGYGLRAASAFRGFFFTHTFSLPGGERGELESDLV